VTVAWMSVTKKQRKYSSGEMLQKVSYSYLFPTNRRERRWWVFVALTAGICEEILFRGFLLHYLHTSPWALSLTSALLLSPVIFGLQHLYQKAAGAVTSAVAGAIFGLLFLLTGNLLFPIAFHAALDLRLLVSLRPPVE
jgi:membrane protease YdiL (CAAX protease family)